ncbi:hypothetical protein [Streptococcus henryi]|uniref:PD-(D/E)XK nuclease domain-containing protein n=1 Tax=Streptococcus henryi TaxID=439219 RepID=UPI0003A1B099|nr:hypothetical protein [Streptococcus henryi]
MEQLKTKKIKLLISQANVLSETIKRTLSDTSDIIGKYNSCVSYARKYNVIAKESVVTLKENPGINIFNLENTNPFDMTWPAQKTFMETVLLETDFLISFLNNSIEFSEDEFNNLENFIASKLRKTIHEKPLKEKEIQNAIENLFLGKNWSKGIDYDRETGKFNFSGREYVPDFIIPNINLAIEVKLLREGKKSKIIEEINADITAYSKNYSKLLFIIYDLGEIRDELELRRDLEVKDDIKVIVVKH